ncbi:MAG TPA: hypothetical protein VI479_16070, partial [Blastocatellia bacterium]
MLNRGAFRFISLALILTLLSCLASYNTDAQEPKQTQPQADAVEMKDETQANAHTADKNAVFKLDKDLVSLDVMVVDQNNLAVAGLKKEDFTIYEDKVKQTVENVIRKEVPVSFGIVIDTSGSMWSKIKTVADAAVSLIRQMQVDDEAF